MELSTHGSKFKSVFVIMSELIFFVDGGLDSKLQHCGPCKISRKKSKTSHFDCSGHIEGDIMQNHEEKKV
jgi:hypothetical protein